MDSAISTFVLGHCRPLCHVRNWCMVGTFVASANLAWRGSTPIGSGFFLAPARVYVACACVQWFMHWPWVWLGGLR